jgi:hypothetical protein
MNLNFIQSFLYYFSDEKEHWEEQYMAEAPAQKIRGSQTKHLSSTCSASNIT